jgi:acyl carrier protein
MTDAISAFVIACLEEKRPLPGATLEEKVAYDYLDQGHIDSFGIMQLILAVEERFAIRLDQDDLQSDEIRTVGGLAGIVARHVRAREA